MFGAPRDLWLVVASATFVGTTISLNLPLLSLVLERAGWDAGAIGLNATAAGLGIFLIAPLLRPLGERLGARGAIALGAAVSAAGMLLLPLRVDFTWWYAVRLLIGTGTSLVFVVSEAAINALTPEHARGRVIALYATVFCVGYVAGPAVVAVLGTGGWPPFLASAGLFLAGALPALFARSIDRALAPGSARAGPAAWLSVLRRGALPFLTIFVFGFVETAVFALWPLYAVAAGAEEGGAALAVSIWIAGNFLLQYPVGWLADRLPRLAVLAAVALLAALQFALLAAVGPLHPLAPGLLFLAGGLAGSLYSLALVLIGQRFSGFELALANTAFVAVIQIGAILGPAACGLAMGLAGTGILPLVLLLPLLFPALAALGGWRLRRSLTGTYS